MRALITETNPEYREELKNILAEQGFSNDFGESFEMASKLADCEEYDIICVNHELHDGLAEQLVAYCNDHERHKNTPILLLTNNSQLSIKDLPVRVDEVIHRLSREQVGHQIEHFVDLHLDPVFVEGRILFVEDDDAIANVILEILQKTGYRVSHFRSAEEACKEYDNVTIYGSHNDAYDLAITALGLQGDMKGEDLIKSIRSYEDGRGFIPIIAITSDHDDQLRISLYHQGVNDCLTKPILHEELMVRIGNLITNKRLLDKVHDIRRELLALATTDKLTGCHNRHSMMEFSGKFISQARRHKYSISMMVIDLDHFKLVNDTHGHAAGDVVLQLIGALLNHSFREGDLVTRYGGEEFVVLLSYCDEANAMKKAEQVRTSIEDLRPHDLKITASIGVSTIEPGMSVEFEAMFQAGDAAVYQAKDSGRNRVVSKPVE